MENMKCKIEMRCYVKKKGNKKRERRMNQTNIDESKANNKAK